MLSRKSYQLLKVKSSKLLHHVLLLWSNMPRQRRAGKAVQNETTLSLRKRVVSMWLLCLRSRHVYVSFRYRQCMTCWWEFCNERRKLRHALVFVATFRTLKTLGRAWEQWRLAQPRRRHELRIIIRTWQEQMHYQRYAPHDI